MKGMHEAYTNEKSSGIGSQYITSEEEIATLVDIDNSTTNAPVLHDTDHSSSTEEADINARIEAMTDMVANHLWIPLQPRGPKAPVVLSSSAVMGFRG